MFECAAAARVRVVSRVRVAKPLCRAWLTEESLGYNLAGQGATFHWNVSTAKPHRTVKGTSVNAERYMAKGAPKHDAHAHR
jgi:hypothetical protein